MRIPAFWLTRNWVSRLLWPLSCVYGAVVPLRRRYLERRAYRPPVPVVVVGNIFVGGTGKTPLTAYIANYLQRQGQRVVILSRGYGRTVPGGDAPIVVDAKSTADTVGDEPLLLHRKTGVPVVVCRNRARAARFVSETMDVDVLLCDDALQHYGLARDLKIAVWDGARGVGNGWLLPAGPLRETACRAVDIQVATANNVDEANLAFCDFTQYLAAGEAVHLATGRACPLSELGAVWLVAGIGHPERFIATVKAAGITVLGVSVFADHHCFTRADIENITRQAPDSTPILMTEKDAVKCGAFESDNLWALPVEAVLPPALDARISAFLAAHIGG